jgi:hypothetical protein
MKQYFTFGQIHVHRVNGKTFDCDCVAEIEAPTKGECRDKMFKLFGDKWCFQYDKEQIDKDLHYFPRGIIAVEACNEFSA